MGEDCEGQGCLDYVNLYGPETGKTNSASTAGRRDLTREALLRYNHQRIVSTGPETQDWQGSGRARQNPHTIGQENGAQNERATFQGTE